MKQMKIVLASTEEAKRFVSEATKCDFDIDVFYNRVIIDVMYSCLGKSMKSPLSMSLSN